MSEQQQQQQQQQTLTPVKVIYNKGIFENSPHGKYDVLVEFEKNDTIEQKLEKVWREMNVVEGNETPTKLGIRSMSVGDEAIVDGEQWTVQSFGWKRN
jgi:hypothetical protein